MRYAVCLAPDVLLLIALLRMTYVGLHAERRWMFFFLCAWLAYSTITLFLIQIWEAGSANYMEAFLALSAGAWLCGAPALLAASHRLSQHFWQSCSVGAIVLIAALASRYALLSHGVSPLAKLLVLNAWLAVIFGSVFLLASSGAGNPDALLWRCAGAFFLIFGFGYLTIGALELGRWSYPAVVILASLAWLALALFVKPTHECIFNHEKLAFASAAYLTPVTSRRSRG